MSGKSRRARRRVAVSGHEARARNNVYWAAWRKRFPPMTFTFMPGGDYVIVQPPSMVLGGTRAAADFSNRVLEQACGLERGDIDRLLALSCEDHAGCL